MACEVMTPVCTENLIRVDDAMEAELCDRSSKRTARNGPTKKSNPKNMRGTIRKTKKDGRHKVSIPQRIYLSSNRGRL